MEGDDVTKLQTVAQAASTELGKLWINVLMLVLGIALTAVSTLTFFSLQGFRDTASLALRTAQAASNRNDVQDQRFMANEKEQSRIVQEVGGVKGDVRANTKQIQINSDQIGNFGDTQKEILHSLRPGH